MILYRKTCVLCDQKIRASYKLCTQHFIQYKDQMHEPWFIALAEAQQKQDQIDKYESYGLPYHSATDIYGKYTAPELLSKRDVGRPSTDWRIIEKVLCLYDQSIDDVRLKHAIRPASLRAIAKALDNKIGYVTIRNILLEYRKETYLDKRYK